MLDLNNSFDKPKLSRKTILERLSEEQILTHYIGKFKLGGCMNSPLREDKIPSFSVFHSNYYNKLIWKDHSSGASGDVFDIVSELFMTDLYGALLRINNDFGLGLDSSNLNYVPSNTSYKEVRRINKIAYRKSKLEVKYRRWSTCDYLYWTVKYGITEKQLKYYGIFPVDLVFVNDKIIWKSSKSNPIYVYVFYKDNEYTYKVYRPLEKDKRYKWLNNANRTILQGWDQLPKKGELLILTKSLKDVVVYRTLGIISLACQSELGIIKDSVMEELKSRFTNIILQNDFDYAGVTGTNAMRKMYDLPYVFLQNFRTRSNGLKDISDYREHHNQFETKSFIMNKLNNIKNGK